MTTVEGDIWKKNCAQIHTLMAAVVPVKGSNSSVVILLYSLCSILLSLSLYFILVMYSIEDYNVHLAFIYIFQNFVQY